MPGIHQHDVGPLLLDELEGRADVAGASDNPHLAADAEQVRQALLDTSIGIDDHDPR